MRCPSCDRIISWAWIESECIEANDVFGCPGCGESLRYCVDEGTYRGAMEQFLEIADDE